MMTASELDDIVWHTSSYCGNGGDCVEVAPSSAGVLVRDSKDADGSVLAVTATSWRAFLATVTS